jgi:hypothetical protein
MESKLWVCEIIRGHCGTNIKSECSLLAPSSLSFLLLYTLRLYTLLDSFQVSSSQLSYYPGATEEMRCYQVTWLFSLFKVPFMAPIPLTYERYEPQ